MAESVGSTPETTSTDTTVRQWFHFRWRILLVMPVLACLVVAYVAWGQTYQKQAIADLKSRGAIVRTEAVAIPFFEQVAGTEFSQQVIEIYWIGQDVTAEDLAALSRATSLRKLELTKSTINGAGLQHLNGLSDLYTLHLSGTNVGDEALPHVSHLHALEILSLNGTKVTDDGLENLAGLSRLERLFLNSTPITDKGLDHLARMTQLKELSLKDLSITDAGLLKLKGLVNLEILALDNNPNLTLEGIVALRKTIPKLVFSLDEQSDTNPAMQKQQPQNIKSDTG